MDYRALWFMTVESHNLPFALGSEPNPKEKENFKETKLKARNSTTRLELFCLVFHSHVSCTEYYLGDEHSLTLEKKPKASNIINGTEIKETCDAHNREPLRAHTECNKMLRSQFPVDHLWPFHKRLVTSLQAISEAMYQDSLGMGTADEA
nr:protein FRG2-like-2 [Microcebus murinus]